MSKRRLGKGIDALLQGRPLEELSNMTTVHQVDIDQLRPNPNQPRTRFDESSLRELAGSIREKGVIQPIIAEDRGDGLFTIVAGERRYRAAKIAGLAQVPVISQDFSDKEKLEIALVENLQREDLNPLDEAQALEHAVQLGGYTQDQLAKRLGKSRSAVANALRLLKLEPDYREALASGEISAGHARALLSVLDPDERKVLYDRIRNEEMSVREAEVAANPERAGQAGDESAEDEPAIQIEGETLDVPGGAPGKDTRTAAKSASGDGKPPVRKSPEIRRLEEELIRVVGSKVVIRPPGKDGVGRIEIDYYNTDDIERLIELLGITLD